MRALDKVLEQYGPDVTFEDAVLIYEVSYPDPHHEGERCTEVDSETTTHRATVAGGVAMAYAYTQLNTWAAED